MASICSAVGLGVKQETTAISTSRNTSSQISKMSQLVCQNQLVYSQYQPFMTSLPVLVKIFVSRRTIPMMNPTIMPTSPAFGVIRFEKIPNANTATMAGARSDWMPWR